MEPGSHASPPPHPSMHTSTLRQVLFLQKFPFDRQILHVKFQSFGVHFGRWYCPMEETLFRIRDDKMHWNTREVILTYLDDDWLLERTASRVYKEGPIQASGLQGYMGDE